MLRLRPHFVLKVVQDGPRGDRELQFYRRLFPSREGGGEGGNGGGADVDPLAFLRTFVPSFHGVRRVRPQCMKVCIVHQPCPTTDSTHKYMQHTHTYTYRSDPRRTWGQTRRSCPTWCWRMYRTLTATGSTTTSGGAGAGQGKQHHRLSMRRSGGSSGPR